MPCICNCKTISQYTRLSLFSWWRRSGGSMAAKRQYNDRKTTRQHLKPMQPRNWELTASITWAAVDEKVKIHQLHNGSWIKPTKKSAMAWLAISKLDGTVFKFLLGSLQIAPTTSAFISDVANAVIATKTAQKYFSSKFPSLQDWFIRLNVIAFPIPNLPLT